MAKHRLWEIDTFRGLAIILMIIFHILYDLALFNVASLDIYYSLSGVFPYLVGGLFIFIVGISLTLSYSAIEDKLNQGVSIARNIGIKECSGKYITFLDDDDIFLPKKIERQMNIFNKRDVGLVYCPLGFKKNENIVFVPFSNKKNFFIGLSHQHDIIMTFILKKECFDSCGLFDEKLLYHEDRDLIYRVGKKYKFDFINNPDYIFYNPSISRLSVDMNKIINGKKILYDKHKNDFEDKESYYSEMHYEIAGSYLLFKDYKNFLKHFKLSIDKKPKNLRYILYKHFNTATGRINPAYLIEQKKIKWPKNYNEIIS